MGPIWEGLKEHWACTDALFINVNVQTDPYIAELNDISTTPTFATFKSGRVVDAVRGEGRVRGQARRERVAGGVLARAGIEHPGHAVAVPQEEDLGDRHSFLLSLLNPDR